MSPGLKDPREQLADLSHPGAAEVHHHRDVFDRPHFDGTLERRPLRPRIVRALDADDESLVLARHVGRRLHLHVGEVLLVLAAGAAAADDVDEGQHAGPRAIDHHVLHVLEVAPSGPARVGERGHPRAEAEPVGIHHAVVGAESLADRGPVDMRVEIDQAGRDVQTR